MDPTVVDPNSIDRPMLVLSGRSEGGPQGPDADEEPAYAAPPVQDLEMLTCQSAGGK